MVAASVLRKLLCRESLTPDERASARQQSISAAALAKVVLADLQECPSFPPKAQPWKAGEAVWEGFFLERRQQGGLRLHWQRHHPIDPFTLVESFHRDFRSADAAVAAYLRKEHGKSIDGITIHHAASTPSRILLVGLGYLGALLASLAFFAVRECLAPMPAAQASSGMAAFGDAVMFFTLFILFSSVPTALGLYFLRDHARAWRTLAKSTLVLASTAPLAALTDVLTGLLGLHQGIWVLLGFFLPGTDRRDPLPGGSLAPRRDAFSRPP